MTTMKVYSWGGEHHSPDYAGSWVNVTWAAAVGSLDELRSLCTEQRVKYSGKRYQSKRGRAEWEAAVERPGCLLFRNEEPTGNESRDWQVLAVS